MPVVAVANPKGGVGKSTLATNIAGYWASRGHAVALGDIDRQQSSRLWLQQRPESAAPIALWDARPDWVSQPPRGSTHAVLDTPAGLQGWRLNDVLRQADRIIIPLQPGVFDMFATREFLDDLAQQLQRDPSRVGIVGTRVDERTIAAEQLREFIASLGFLHLATLRSAQNYVHLAAQGLTLFDAARSRVQRDLEQWQPICAWLDELG